jgi:peptidoglycan/LPS O-acetylase OafA/YrhL
MATSAATGLARRRWRSVRAVLLGFLAVVVLSLGTDQMLHTFGVYSPWGEPMREGLFLLASGYRVIYGVLGSYITATLAPASPMKHSIVGGLIGTVAAAAGAVATWNGGPAFGPYWYPILLVITALPCAWAGSRSAGAVGR